MKATADGPAVDGDPACDFGHELARGDGVFATWRWDGERLTVRNDRYGLFPLFYAVLDDGVAVSTSAVELVRRGASAELDHEALVVFRTLGFFLDDDTPFSQVKALPPAAELVWDGELTLVSRLELGGSLEISRSDAIAQYAELFHVAVGARLTDEPFAVPLSGGRDSRHILLELLAYGLRPQSCVTARHEWPYATDDVEVARTVASELGVDHVAAPRLPRFASESRKNVLTHFCADEHAWLLTVTAELEGAVGTFYDGIAGDVLSASLFQTPENVRLYREGNLRAVADLILRDEGLDHPEFQLPLGLTLEDATELRRDRVARELERFSEATNPVSMFYFYNRTRREIALAPFGVMAGIGTALCPYVDHRLFDFLASLPPELTLDKRLHTDTIAFAHPRASALPYATGWRPGRSNRELGSLAWRVLEAGVRNQPSRLAAVPGLIAHQARREIDESFRLRTTAVDPTWLLYIWQLEDVARAARKASRAAAR